MLDTCRHEETRLVRVRCEARTEMDMVLASIMIIRVAVDGIVGINEWGGVSEVVYFFY